MTDLSGQIKLDTTNFKAGLSELNRQIRLTESGFRAAASGLGDWTKTASGLELRIKALNDQIGVQSTKVDGLKRVYTELAGSGKASAKELDELQIKINKETETLGKMQSELSQSETALSNMGEDAKTAAGKVDDLGDKEDKARESTNKLAGVMSGLGGAMKAGATAIAGVAAAAAGVGAAVTGMVLKAADGAGALVDMSNETGISVERLQELAYVGDQVGTSADTMTGAMSKLVKSMSSAREQQAGFDEQLANGVMEDEISVPMDMAAAFNQLGVSVTDSKGQLRDTEAVFSDAITALGGVANETERDALAMSIFGKSAQDLNPLIKAGADEIGRLTDEAHQVGAVMSEENVGALEAFGDQLGSLKAGLQGTAGTLAAAFLPGFSGLVGTLQGYGAELAGVVQGADGDLSKMSDGVGKLLGKIATDIARQAPQMLQAALGILQGLVNAIVQNLPALLPAVIGIITSIIKFIVQNLPLLINAGIQVIMALINGIVPQLPLLITAAIQMITTLATGIAEAIPQIMPVMIGIIPQLILALLENLPMLINAALQLIIALVNGLIASLPILIGYAPQIITAVFNALIQSLPLIGQAAVQLIVTLVTGIIGMLPSLGTAAGQVIGALVNGIKGLMGQILTVGGDIVNGVWQGIQAKAASFKSQITSFFKNIIDAVKKALGIKSPSTVFAGIGENMALGLGAGFSDQIAAVGEQVRRGVAGLSKVEGSLNVTGSGLAVAGAASGPVYINVTANMSKPLDMYSLAHAVASEIQSRRR